MTKEGAFRPIMELNPHRKIHNGCVGAWGGGGGGRSKVFIYLKNTYLPLR